MATAQRTRLFDPSISPAQNGSAQHTLANPGIIAGTSLSIIVPTLNEAENIEPLLSEIHMAVDGLPLEVIFVDDSADNTALVIQENSSRYPFDVRLIARPPDRRTGLGSAVVEGMHLASNQWICVMDGDLQHPPTVILELLGQAQTTGSDLVLGSRLVDGGSTEGLSSFRSFVSRALAVGSRLLFHNRLKNVTDPLTGFFVFKKDAVDPDILDPDGFKILLDILIRCPKMRVSEVPFTFGHRHGGESKASSRELFRLFRHMVILQLASLAHLLRFVTVGASGLVVNVFLLAIFTELLGFHYLLSAFAATQGSTLWNYIWTEVWVFGDRSQRQEQLGRRLVSFFLMNNFFFLLRGPFLALLVSRFGMHYLTANIITLALMTGLRFIFADRVIWRKGRTTMKTKDFYYSIHDIINIHSDRRLPELGSFLVDNPPEVVDLDVRINMNPYSFQKPDSILYQETFGRAGFCIVINRSEAITEIVASPLVGKSPHVLYTNVVEPILRWMFVRKGYALMHGACVALDGQAIFITAKTDTGKTTTILHTMRENLDTSDFLSDDMTIVADNGQVFSYPKPLTISQHTVQAIGGAPLSKKQRMFLQVQSRLHSRTGRRIGLSLANSFVGGATLNAIVQMFIPPPKYMVDSIIPNARYADSGQLAHIVIIERGPDGDFAVKEPEKSDILIANAEDAYGFPPYPVLADVLSSWNGEDLHRRELAIVTSAVRDLPAHRLASTTFDWYARFPKLIDSAAVEQPKVKTTDLGELATPKIQPVHVAASTD
jgi:dolichol-phosphate mannosyltransferase